jgi:hypothetical protein
MWSAIVAVVTRGGFFLRAGSAQWLPCQQFGAEHLMLPAVATLFRALAAVIPGGSALGHRVMFQLLMSEVWVGVGHAGVRLWTSAAATQRMIACIAA